jgi:hypothetical protein
VTPFGCHEFLQPGFICAQNQKKEKEKEKLLSQSGLCTLKWHQKETPNLFLPGLLWLWLCLPLGPGVYFFLLLMQETSVCFVSKKKTKKKRHPTKKKKQTKRDTLT